MKMKKYKEDHKFLLFLGILLFFPLLIPAKAILYNLLDDGEGKINPLKRVKIKKIDEELAFNPFYELIPGTRRRPENSSMMIINISTANHLSPNLSFISNITSGVKTLDGTWSEEISNGDYIRVVFEKKLTKENDIRVYLLRVSGDPYIEVFEKNQSRLIANFTNISDGQYNRVLLTNLSGNQQDTFDLHILGGSVQFDHIVDPVARIATYNFTTNLSNRNVYRFYPASAQTFNGTAGANGIYGNLSASNYTGLGTRGGTEAQIWSRGGNDAPAFRFNFTAKEVGGMNRSQIQWLTVNFTGRENASETATAYLWNFTSGALAAFGVVPDSTGNISMNYTENVNATDFIQSSSNNITVYVHGASYDAIDGIFADFIQVDVMYLFDIVPPNWSDNQTNSTLASSTISHSVFWTDDLNLNGSILSFDNGNGSFLNDTWVVMDSSNWTNTSKVVNSTADSIIRWRVYTNDSYGNINVTSNFQYITTAGPSDSCTCTDGTDWIITNGDNCVLTTTCNLGTGRLRVMDGALRISSTGRLNALGCYVQNGKSFYVENGGRAICR